MTTIELTWWPEGCQSNLGYSKVENRQHAYACGWMRPNYPVPAIPLNVCMFSDVYIGCMYIERLNWGEDDPVIVYLYDSWDDVSHYYE